MRKFTKLSICILAILFIGMNKTGFAQAPFTPGNVVIYRVGDGVNALINTGNAVFLDEYTTTGTLVQSVPMPTTTSGSNFPLVCAGSASSEGLMTRSADGNYLIMAGYGAALPNATVLTSSASTLIPRIIGVVSSSAVINTTTALTDAASASNPRGACSTDGTSLWIDGGVGGARYAALGATTSTQLSTTVTNLRGLNIFGGQLYTTSASGAFRLATIGTGTPTTSGQTTTNLPGYPTSGGSPYGFFFADLDAGTPGVDVVYVADDGGTIQKYSLVAGSWVANGTIAIAAIRNITGSVSGTTVTLYGATASTTSPYTSNLVTLTDATGYNATIASTVTTLATITSTAQAFRGIAFAPGATISAPTIQASNITFSGVTTTGMTANWTSGNGAKRIVIMNTVNSFTNPVDGTSPTANTTYSGSGEQVVYNNSGNSVSVTGLTGSTTYWFRVYEYNGTGPTTKYLTSTATLNPNSQATTAAATAPFISLPTSATITNTTAVLGGTITADGGSPITERGTVWKITTGVTIADNKLAEGGTTVATFSHTRSALPAKTQIFFKAYATNSVGTSLTSEASFFTLANEPTSHVTGFSAVPAGTTTINLTWTAAAAGADGYLILQKTGAAAPTGIPVDATGYTVGSILGDGTVAALVTPGSLLTKTIAGLSPATQYSFTIIPFAWDGINNATLNYYTAPTIPSANATTTGTGPATYTWQGADNGLWTTSTNWNPTRFVPATTDILQFNDGTTKTVTALPAAETIGKLVMANNTAINLQSAATAVLSISGVAGTDLDIPAGCSLNLNAANAITIAIATAATGSISGNMTFSSTVATAHRLTAADPGAIIFNSGSVFTAGTFFSGNPFGTTSLGSVIFASGSTFIQQAGSNPFGASQPGSVVVFQTGSLYKVIANLTPSFSGRTYANFEMDATGMILTPTGGSPVSVDNLTITNGTFNFNMTGPTTGIHQIRGNIQVASGAVLNFAPASAGTVTLNGTAIQSVSGAGTISGAANSTLEIANAAGVNLNTTLTLAGTLKLTSGLFTLGTNNLVLGTAAVISGTPAATAMIVATGTGQLQKGFPTGFTGSFTFPVGDATVTAEYSPVTLNFISGTFATGNYAAVNLINAKYPTDPNTGSYLKRYWNLSQSGITAFTCNAIYQYVPADVNGTESLILCTQVNPVPYVAYDPANTTLHQLTSSGLTAFGTFTGTQPPPSVITTAATAIGANLATLNGTVNANTLSTAASFEYGLTTAYGTPAAAVPANVTGLTATNISAAITGLTVGTTYHFRAKGINSSGTTYGADMTFSTGCPIPSAAGSITGPANVCSTGTGYVYTVSAIANATTYTWALPAGATITAGAGTNTITVSFPAGSASGNIAVTGSSICGIGSTSPTFAVTVNPLPVPTISGPANVCINSSGNVYTTEGGMSSYNWTISAGGTITSGAASAAITVTWTTAGAKTVTASYTNGFGCTAATPSSFAVNVSALPTPAITGPGVVCASSTGVVYSTQAGMTNYNWAVSIGGTILSGAGTNTITVSWPYAGNRTVSVNYSNTTGCSSATPAVYNVTVNPAAIPIIGSSNNPCINSTNNQYFTDAGMLNYSWAISGGGTIVSGQGTSTINVTWTSVGSQWVSVTYSNTYGCAAVTPTVYNLFVNPLPNAAGTITGTAAVCAGTSGVAFSCAEILNATTYTWTLPAGTTISTGAGTRNITANFGASAVSGNITVAGTNTCGNGTVSPDFAVTVNPLPGNAGTIAGPASVCAGETGVAYSVPSVSGATSYVWTVPAGAVITSGATTKNIVVSFGTTTGNGVITVKGTNTCGNGAVSPSFSVTVHAVPAAPVVTMNGAVLTSSASSGNQWYYEGNLIPGATGQTYTVTHHTGFYWCVVTLSGCSSPISNKVWVVVTGQQELQNSNFNVYPVPNDGRFTLSITSPVRESFTILIYNQIGAKIFDIRDVTVDGSFEKQVDLRPVSDGIYSVVFLNSEHRVVRKVLVNK